MEAPKQPKSNQEAEVSRRKFLFGGTAALGAAAAGTYGVTKVVNSIERTNTIETLSYELLGTEMDSEAFNSIIAETGVALAEATKVLALFNNTEPGIPESLEQLTNLANNFSARTAVEYAQTIVNHGNATKELESYVAFFEEGKNSFEAPLYATIAIIKKILNGVGALSQRIKFDQRTDIGFGIRSTGKPRPKLTSKPYDVRPEELVAPFDEAMENINQVYKRIYTTLEELKERAVRMTDSNESLE